MKTARAHRKFAIYTIYLDTWLEGEEEVRDGETRQQTLERILDDLEQTAATLRKKAGTPESSPPQMITKAGEVPVISKEVEQLEIDIDNCQTVGELHELADRVISIAPGGLIAYYNERVKALNGEMKPVNFTDGLS
jgi:hypothetical protein